MNGWVYLPRFIDKIRLHLAGKLAADYQENFTNGFDKAWLKAAGVTAEQMIELVKNSITDGEVADWVSKNVKKTETEKAAFRDFVLKRGTEGGEITERLKARKMEAGNLLYVTGGMWSPALAVFATKKLFHESARDLPWKWGSARYASLGYLIPIAYVLPVAFGVSVICFLLVHIAPGDPLNSVLPPDASAAMQEEMRHK